MSLFDKYPPWIGPNNTQICLPVQLMKHDSVMTDAPWQGWPPFWGAGFVQVRMRWMVPVPQVTLQGLESLNSVYPPLMAAGFSEENNLALKTCLILKFVEILQRKLHMIHFDWHVSSRRWPVVSFQNTFVNLYKKLWSLNYCYSRVFDYGSWTLNCWFYPSKVPKMMWITSYITFDHIAR